MENFLGDKRVILFTALLALISLVVLGSALKDVSFLPAQPLSRPDSETVRISVGDVVTKIVEIPVWKQMAFWVLLFFLLLVVSALLSPELRKRLIMGLLRTGLFVIFILYITKNDPGILQRLFALGNFGTNSTTPSLLKDIPPPVFEPPQISGWFSFFVAFGVIVLIAVLIWRVNRWWARQNELLALRRPLDEIASAARISLKELSIGNISSYDSIIQCYERMSGIVDAKRGLARDPAMTPSEFAARLEKAGLPRGPVNRLTRLFESVRYGIRISNQSEIDEAISCLSSVLEYCGEAV